MEKRGAITAKTSKDDTIAKQIKAEKDKRNGGKKKEKHHGNEDMFM